MNTLKDQFLLDPSITFLNHGSFGACPRPVFETYQYWQRELEHQPVEFLKRRAAELLAKSRERLASYLGVESEEVVYFTNPTSAINMVAKNMVYHESQKNNNHIIPELRKGDEILATDHEYGAMDRTWRFICKQSGARYINHPIHLPVRSTKDIIESIWERVTDRTRILFVSHITSPTALTFPVSEICQKARRAGILTIIDGAHAPGQIALNLKEVGADIYTGACHKWLCAPKGSAFLYVRKELQEGFDPLVVSWGYESAQPSYSRFIDYHEWQGTRDLAAFLSVPSAIDFQLQNDWQKIRKDCHTLGSETRSRIDSITGLEPICPDDWFHQMFSTRLAKEIEIDLLERNLYEKFHIEVPIISWNDQNMIRVSFQGYNGKKDADLLLEALKYSLGKF